MFNGYDTFYRYYGFVDDRGVHMEGPQQFSVLIYFTLTSLSTIGYGDFCARSVDEKIIVCMVLTFLISIYSYNMSLLMSVLKDYKKISYGPGENRKDLVKWLGLLTYINDGNPIKRSL